MSSPTQRLDGLRTAGLWALLAVCVIGWTVPQTSMDYRRNRWVDSDSLLFLPTGEYLDAVSLGYQNMLADTLYLWSIQYYGHHRTAEGRRYLWRIYDVITDLDPKFQDAYLTGALVMALDMDDPNLAIELLEKGAANNPDDWIYWVEAAHYAWISLGEFERAAGYFDRALEKEGVPAMIRRARAGVTAYAGDTQRALDLWVDIFRDAEAAGDERITAIAWQHIYDLDVAVDVERVDAAVAQYRAARGELPVTLADLVRARLLPEVPRTANDQEYIYNSATGSVTDPLANASRADR
jgi:tetratricopeptide (TPR) repeat protein